MGIFSGLLSGIGKLGGALAGIPFGGIGTALSGVAALTQKKPKASALGVDYAKLVREAQAAGFNPLTALMYGGSQAYTRDYGPALSRMADVGQVMQNFAQQQFDRQMQTERLALDRGYFDQAQRADARDEQRLGLERRQVERQLAGAVFGPVFGPAARAQPVGYYDDQSSKYGPLVAPAAGLGRAVRDVAADMWSKWHQTGSARLPTLPQSYEAAKLGSRRPVDKSGALLRRKTREGFMSLEPFNY